MFTFSIGSRAGSSEVEDDDLEYGTMELTMRIFCSLILCSLACRAEFRQAWTGVALENIALVATNRQGQAGRFVAERYDEDGVALKIYHKMDVSNILRAEIGSRFAWPDEECAVKADNAPGAVEFSVSEDLKKDAACPILKIDKFLIRPSTREIIGAAGRCAYTDRARGVADFNGPFVAELRSHKAAILKRDPRSGCFVYSWTSRHGVDVICVLNAVNLEGGGIGFAVEIMKKSEAKPALYEPTSAPGKSNQGKDSETKPGGSRAIGSLALYNPDCGNHGRTRGYPCRKNEGTPCGKCGG